MSEGWYSEATATFGDRLCAAREAGGLSVSELGRRIGVGDKTVRAWEDDQSEPRSNRMQMLAGLLNVSLMWLMTGEGPGVAPPGEEPARGAGVDVDALAELHAEVKALRGLIRQAGERVSRLDRQLGAALAARG
jgi:transcriptional regulator with XRE-family HTH domain